jgi:hypothetical protein
MNQLPNDPREQRQKEMVKAVKEGIKEWLSEQMSMFGWWSVKGLAALALSALVYFWLSTHGWKAPNITP